jgi:hypothetical protein
MPNGKKWTEEDIALLSEKYGLISDRALAKKLGRTVGAMRARASLLHIVRTQNFLTASDVADIFGIDSNTLSKVWIPRGLLKAKKANVGSGRSQPWHIEEKDLVEFIKNHQDRYDPARVNPELYPYWANQVKRFVPKNYVKKHGQLYSATEDAFILNNRGKLTQQEMAERLHRTKESVHYRIVFLRSKGRLLPYQKNWKSRYKNGSVLAVRWTQAEDTFLRENWGRPLTAEELAQHNKRWGFRFTAQDASKHLKRSTQACWSRAHRLGLVNENWNKNKDLIAS